MDPQITELARVAGTTMVTLMATHTWEAARDGMVSLWQRFQPDRADAVGEDFDATRQELLAAREHGDGDSEAELVAEWQVRVRRLLAAQPDVADELRTILDELAPRVPAADPAAVTLNAHVSGSGRVYQAGRDQHISER
ncbi:hypothetical protein [Streptomyces erythrochromogenes]|uniref:hypothetical protein n=1 Tax=Streptomyces erythrochromogenes TaxID=285574 RepID=UPI003403BD65